MGTIWNTSLYDHSFVIMQNTPPSLSTSIKTSAEEDMMMKAMLPLVRSPEEISRSQIERASAQAFKHWNQILWPQVCNQSSFYYDCTRECSQIPMSTWCKMQLSQGSDTSTNIPVSGELKTYGWMRRTPMHEVITQQTVSWYPADCVMILSHNVMSMFNNHICLPDIYVYHKPNFR